MNKLNLIGLVLFATSITNCAKKGNTDKEAVSGFYNSAAAKDLTQGNIDGAIAKYKILIQQSPNVIFNYAGAGNAYLMKGNKDSALYYFSESVDKDPSFFEGRGAIAMLKYDKGLKDEFNEEINKAIESCKIKLQQKSDNNGNKVNLLFLKILIEDQPINENKFSQLMAESGTKDLFNYKNPLYKTVQWMRNFNRDAFINQFCDPLSLNQHKK